MSRSFVGAINHNELIKLPWELAFPQADSVTGTVRKWWGRGRFPRAFALALFAVAIAGE